jgi:hypothetical protein
MASDYGGIFYENGPYIGLVLAKKQLFSNNGKNEQKFKELQ